MAAQLFSIQMIGYYMESDKDKLPAKSGIYCVYNCKYNAATDKVSLNNIIYIGESDDIKSRVANHDKHPAWQRHVKHGEVLCFSFGLIEADNRVRCEAAIIFRHNPPENTEYTNAFPFDQTRISLSGKTDLLDTDFSVQRTE